MISLRTLRSLKLKKIAIYSLKRNFGACSVLMVNKTPTDPIQKLFLEKLREYNKQSMAQGGKMVGATPEVEKSLEETLNKIKKQYGADKEDFTKFPSFRFQDPQLDPINLKE